MRFTSLSIYMLAFNPTAGSSQCLSCMLAFTMAKSVTLQNHLTILRASSEFMRLACVHPTESTEWARRAHSLIVRPACVHQGKVHNPTLSFEWSGGPHHDSMRFAYVTTARFITQLQALQRPGGPLQCLSGLLAFTMARFITSSGLVNLSSSYAFLSFMINFQKNLNFMFYP